MADMYTLAEFFCGCGGFSHGFWQTGQFETVFGNDIKKEALYTFKRNHSHDGKEPIVVQKDIRSVSDQELNTMFAEKELKT